MERGITEAMLPTHLIDRTPASACFRNPMICSSEKRFFTSILPFENELY